MPVSFSKDVEPLFRVIDIDHMKPSGVLLNSYAYMSDPTGGYAHAKAVLEVLRNRSMPPGGPYWPESQLDLFVEWMAGGYLP